MTKFCVRDENLLRRKIFPDKIFPDKVIAFPKSAVTPSKIYTVINYCAKALKHFHEKYFRGYCGFGFHCSNYTLSKF